MVNVIPTTTPTRIMDATASSTAIKKKTDVKLPVRNKNSVPEERTKRDPQP
jgi:hypothetical protein